MLLTRRQLVSSAAAAAIIPRSRAARPKEVAPMLLEDWWTSDNPPAWQQMVVSNSNSIAAWQPPDTARATQIRAITCIPNQAVTLPYTGSAGQGGGLDIEMVQIQFLFPQPNNLASAGLVRIGVINTDPGGNSVWESRPRTPYYIPPRQGILIRAVGTKTVSFNPSDCFVEFIQDPGPGM